MIEQRGLFDGTESYFCGECGRSLSNPESIRRGIGPVCAHRTGKGNSMATEQREFSDIAIPEPITSGIILRRVDGVVMTNVPHAVVWHSPSGFEWGYHGSGPADLALNVVEAVLDALGFEGRRDKCYRGDAFFAACRLHQEFKRDFIAPIDEAGDVLPWDAVREWVVFHVGRLRGEFGDDADASVGRFPS